MEYYSPDDWIHFVTQKSVSEEDTHTGQDKIAGHVVKSLSGSHMVGTLGNLHGLSMASHQHPTKHWVEFC